MLVTIKKLYEPHENKDGKLIQTALFDFDGQTYSAIVPDGQFSEGSIAQASFVQWYSKERKTGGIFIRLSA